MEHRSAQTGARPSKAIRRLCLRTIRTFGLLTALSLLATASARGSEGGAFVWVTEDRELLRIDVESNQAALLTTLPHKPDALAVIDQSAWVSVKKELIRFDDGGNPTERFDLSSLPGSAGEGGRLAPNPYDGSIWLAEGKHLLRLANGEQRLHWQAPERIVDIALDVDETLWVLTKKQLLRITSTGDLHSAVALHPAMKSAEHLAIDGLRGTVWIGGHKELYALDASEPERDPRAVTGMTDDRIKDAIEAIAVHPVFGTLWVLSKKHLRIYDREGAFIRAVDLASSGVDEASKIVFEPRSLSLWIGGKKALGRFTGNGELTALIPLGKEAGELAAGTFTLRPTLAIIQPENESLTSNPRPVFEVQVGAACNGSACMLVDDYLSSLAMDARLNGLDISDRFILDGTIARYAPGNDLPEGGNELTARVTDIFGHSSELQSTRFTVDTVPPVFLSLTPADGSVLTDDAVVVTGQVDDPTANVLLATSDGTLLGMGGANFSFAVTLQRGENRFVLTAQDPAGNMATRSLLLTYRTSTLVVTNLKSGDRVAGGSVFLTGTFDGPPNTGLIVGGKAAYTKGNEFFVEVELDPGENQLVLTASTEDGLLAQETITLYSDPADTSFSVTRLPGQAATMKTVAGNGNDGFGGDGGPATQAMLNYPMVLALGSSGDLFIGDIDNERVRRVTADGVITTYAGGYTPPYSCDEDGFCEEPERNFCTEGDGGPATAVGFNYISDVATSRDGVLYIADEGANCVRRVDPDGRIHTVAGTGAESTVAVPEDGRLATETELAEPLALAVGPDGSLYIAEGGYPRIRRVAPDGTIRTIAGNGEYGYGGDGGPATAASFGAIWGLAFDADGLLYVSDSDNYRIRRIGPDGIITTIAGTGNVGYSGDGGPALEAELDYPTGLSFGPDGALYVADENNHVIRRVGPDGTISTVAGTAGEPGDAGDGGPPERAHLSLPADIVFDALRNAIIADSGNARVRAFPTVSTLGDYAPLRAQFEIGSEGANAISLIEVDFDEDGVIDLATSDPSARFEFLYAKAGAYHATFTITDTSGNKHVRKVPVLVKDPAAQDQMLRAIYADMLNRLRVRDIESALKTISGGMRDKYREVFTLLSANLPTIVDQLGTLREGTIGEELAEYVLVRSVNGESVAFLIYFLRGEDGVWRIDGM